MVSFISWVKDLEKTEINSNLKKDIYYQNDDEGVIKVDLDLIDNRFSLNFEYVSYYPQRRRFTVFYNIIIEPKKEYKDKIKRFKPLSGLYYIGNGYFYQSYKDQFYILYNKEIKGLLEQFILNLKSYGEIIKKDKNQLPAKHELVSFTAKKGWNFIFNNLIEVEPYFNIMKFHHVVDVGIIEQDIIYEGVKEAQNLFDLYKLSENDPMVIVPRYWPDRLEINAYTYDYALITDEIANKIYDKVFKYIKDFLFAEDNDELEAGIMSRIDYDRNYWKKYSPFADKIIGLDNYNRKFRDDFCRMYFLSEDEEYLNYKNWGQVRIKNRG